MSRTDEKLVFGAGFAGPFGTQIRRVPDDVGGAGGAEGETEVETPDPREVRMQQMESNQQVLALLSDPDIRAVIESKRQGKPVRVVSEESAPEEEVEQVPPEVANLPEDDPTRKTLEVISGFLDKKLKTLSDELDQRLQSVETLATDVKKKDIQAQVASLRTRYSDFDQYKAKMLDLSKENSKLSVEELYILSKLRSGKLDVTKPSTFSEKPTNQPRGSTKPARKPTDPVRPQGRRGFNEMLSEALGRLDLESLEG